MPDEVNIADLSEEAFEAYIAAQMDKLGGVGSPAKRYESARNNPLTTARRVENRLCTLANAIMKEGKDINVAHYAYMDGSKAMCDTLDTKSFEMLRRDIWLRCVNKERQRLAKEPERLERERQHAIKIARREAEIENSERRRQELRERVKASFSTLETREHREATEQPGANAISGTVFGRIIASRPVNRAASRVTSSPRRRQYHD